MPLTAEGIGRYCAEESCTKPNPTPRKRRRRKTKEDEGRDIMSLTNKGNFQVFVFSSQDFWRDSF
jgi:hypothetical protein